MLLFLVIQGAAALVRLLTLSDLVMGFSSAHDAFRMRFSLAGPLHWVEATTHVVQLVAPVIGFYLTLRIDPRAPRWWVFFLLVLSTYAILDMVGGEMLARQIQAVLGNSSEMRGIRGRMATGAAKNARLVGWAVVWVLYWHRSKRVRNTFGLGGFSRLPTGQEGLLFGPSTSS